ncbi:unnamed protein product [Effrenium voratum]|nr:unnamed protein product [Effrenium voratum]
MIRWRSASWPAKLAPRRPILSGLPRRCYKWQSMTCVAAAGAASRKNRSYRSYRSYGRYAKPVTALVPLTKDEPEASEAVVAHRRRVDRALAEVWKSRSGFECRVDPDPQEDGLNPTTYGEVTASGARHLARAMGLDEAQAGPFVFMDLGSGVGKLVVQAYLEWPSVRSAVGIELAKERAEEASEAWACLLSSGLAQSLRSALGGGVAGEDVHLLQGDMLTADLSQATHIFISSLCLGDHLLGKLVEKLSREATSLHSLASLRALPRSRTAGFCYVGSIYAEMTWTGVEGTRVLLYRRAIVDALQRGARPVVEKRARNAQNNVHLPDMSRKPKEVRQPKAVEEKEEKPDKLEKPKASAKERASSWFSKDAEAEVPAAASSGSDNKRVRDLLEKQLEDLKRSHEAADLKTSRRIVELLESSSQKQKLVDQAEQERAEFEKKLEEVKKRLREKETQSEEEDERSSRLSREAHEARMEAEKARTRAEAAERERDRSADELKRVEASAKQKQKDREDQDQQVERLKARVKTLREEADHAEEERRSLQTKLDALRTDHGGSESPPAQPEPSVAPPKEASPPAELEKTAAPGTEQSSTNAPGAESAVEV